MLVTTGLWVLSLVGLNFQKKDTEKADTTVQSEQCPEGEIIPKQVQPEDQFPSPSSSSHSPSPTIPPSPSSFPSHSTTESTPEDTAHRKKKEDPIPSTSSPSSSVSFSHSPSSSTSPSPSPSPSPASESVSTSPVSSSSSSALPFSHSPSPFLQADADDLAREERRRRRDEKREERRAERDERRARAQQDQREPVLKSDLEYLEERCKLNVHTFYPCDPKKKCLVLDIDYTIFDHKSDFNLALEFKRPYLHEFLKICDAYYNIVIWSATAYFHIQTKMEKLQLFNHPDFNICYVLSKDHMIPHAFSIKRKTYYQDIKPLDLLWMKFPEFFNPGNTIHIDDVVENFVLNPNNGLRIDPFREALLFRQTDRELFYLAQYLTMIADLASFDSLNHNIWKDYIINTLWDLQTVLSLPTFTPPEPPSPLLVEQHHQSIVNKQKQKERENAQHKVEIAWMESELRKMQEEERKLGLIPSGGREESISIPEIKMPLEEELAKLASEAMAERPKQKNLHLPSPKSAPQTPLFLQRPPSRTHKRTLTNPSPNPSPNSTPSPNFTPTIPPNGLHGLHGLSVPNLGSSRRPRSPNLTLNSPPSSSSSSPSPKHASSPNLTFTSPPSSISSSPSPKHTGPSPLPSPKLTAGWGPNGNIPSPNLTSITPSPKIITGPNGNISGPNLTPTMNPDPPTQLVRIPSRGSKVPRSPNPNKRLQYRAKEESKEQEDEKKVGETGIGVTIDNDWRQLTDVKLLELLNHSAADSFLFPVPPPPILHAEAN